MVNINFMSLFLIWSETELPISWTRCLRSTDSTTALCVWTHNAMATIEDGCHFSMAICLIFSAANKQSSPTIAWSAANRFNRLVKKHCTSSPFTQKSHRPYSIKTRRDGRISWASGTAVGCGCQIPSFERWANQSKNFIICTCNLLSQLLAFLG